MKLPINPELIQIGAYYILPSAIIEVEQRDIGTTVWFESASGEVISVIYADTDTDEAINNNDHTPVVADKPKQVRTKNYPNMRKKHNYPPERADCIYGHSVPEHVVHKIEQELHKTKEELAEEYKVSIGTIYRIRRGAHKHCTSVTRASTS